MNSDLILPPISISALQHLLFCERQCAYIHLEQQWVESYLTAHGRQLHEKMDSGLREKRKGKIQEYSIPLFSEKYSLTGKADLVEFQYGEKGELQNVFPVEHKRGKQKQEDWDRVQLCAQAFCLEEMMEIQIDKAYIFYHTTKTREEVSLDSDLRELTSQIIIKVHDLFKSKKTPEAKYTSKCKSCSFLDICKPKTIGRGKSVSRYYGQALIEREE